MEMCESQQAFTLDASKRVRTMCSEVPCQEGHPTLPFKSLIVNTIYLIYKVLYRCSQCLDVESWIYLFFSHKTIWAFVLLNLPTSLLVQNSLLPYCWFFILYLFVWFCPSLSFPLWYRGNFSSCSPLSSLADICLHSLLFFLSPSAFLESSL